MSWNIKDFELIKMDLTVADGTVYDLRFMVLETNVYESLWSNNVTCSLLVNDAKNLIMNFPLFGFETLNLQFQTPQKKIYSKVFRLISISKVGHLRERERVYLLHFVTPEVITNLKTLVSKSYTGMLISDIVNDLHYNWLDGGQINIEPTTAQQHVIIPNIHPCQAINWLSTRAISAGNAGASYLYYQDRNVFQFVTMESRLVQTPVKMYLYQPSNIRKDVPGFKPLTYEVDKHAIDTYTFDHFSDILENLQAGMYGNQLITFSQNRKLWKRYTFDYYNSFNNYKHLYPNPLYSAKKGDLVSPGSKEKLHSTGEDLDNYPFSPEKWLPIRISQLQQLQNTKISLSLPGDSERTVGEIVDVQLPSPEPLINNQLVYDKYFLGHYLIEGIRHMFNTEAYTTTMTLVKDSVATIYP